jgi:hypothetical protein
MDLLPSSHQNPHDLRHLHPRHLSPNPFTACGTYKPCRPGASEDQLDEAERQLGTPLCPALRVLYRVHDGQELEFDRQVDKQRTSMHDSVFHGMFGGGIGWWMGR